MKKMGKINSYISQGGIILKTNIIKNGLDTSRLVNLIICFKSPDEFKMYGYHFPKNLFFVSDVSFGETVGILINKYDMNKKEAISKVKQWHESFCLQRITEEDIEKFMPIVKDANKKIVQKLGKNYEILENDIKIIACFMKAGVNIVHTFDKGFKETCRLLNMNIAQDPIRDRNLEKKIKDNLGK